MNEKKELKSKNKLSQEEVERFMRELRETGKKPKPLRYSPIAYVLGFFAGYAVVKLWNSNWGSLLNLLIVLFILLPPFAFYVFEKEHYKRVFKKRDKYNLED